MERSFFEKLIDWKDNSIRKPLIIEGARATGKTWIANEFGNRFFKDTVLLNFEKEASLHELFQRTLNPKEIIAAIGALAEKSIDPRDTLIIFDEVQEEPRALSSLKYFCEDAPEYHIIATCSFTGIALRKGTSFPVGKVYMETLYPLSFSEYLKIIGLTELVKSIENKDHSFISPFKSTLNKHLKDYFLVGGMPKVVDTFLKSNDYNAARSVQVDILTEYQKDFHERGKGPLENRLKQVWTSIPAQLSKSNRKFQYSQIVKGGRSQDYETAILWLSDCGLVNRSHRITEPQLPLRAYREFFVFKLFLNDIGLLGALSNVPLKTILTGNSIFNTLNGAMAEQFVMQQLISEKNIEPFYYAPNGSRCKIDLVIQNDSSILPIEVMAEENLQAKSLRVFCRKFELKGARLSMSDYRNDEWMTNYPLFAFAQWI